MACLFTSLLDYLFIWLCWVFVTTWRLSLALVSWGYSSLQCTGFSLLWLLLLWSTGSRHAGFSSCSTQAQCLCLSGSVLVSCRLSTCVLQAQYLCPAGSVILVLGLSCFNHVAFPGPGIEPVSPALTGEFSSTVLRGKSTCLFHNEAFWWAELLNFNEVEFSFMVIVFCVLCKKALLPPKSKRYFLVFTPGRLIVLAFTFMSRIHFHLILHKM